MAGAGRAAAQASCHRRARRTTSLVESMGSPENGAAAVERVDLDAVISRIDLIGIVEEVLDVIDLPAIIRDSTGSMASETVRGARMTSITADDAISRAIDRALFRRRRPGVGPDAGSTS